jgi:hypothetical protein
MRSNDEVFSSRQPRRPRRAASQHKFHQCVEQDAERNREMMIRKYLLGAIALGVLSLGSLTQSASAEVIGDCTVTGYTFMGGGIAYTTPAKDYFLAQPLVESSADYWGYGWAKFDVGTATVDEAYLVVDLLGIGAMSITPATPSNPGILNVYNPGAIDVNDLGTNPGLRATLQGNLAGTTPMVGDFTMTSNGTYAIDITDIYNDWVDGSITNNGLILAAPDDGAGTKYASLGSTEGNAPYISTIAVPEPASMALLGCGAMAMMRRRARG